MKYTRLERLCPCKSTGSPIGTVLKANMTQIEWNGSLDKRKQLLIQVAVITSIHTFFSMSWLKCQILSYIAFGCDTCRVHALSKYPEIWLSMSLAYYRPAKAWTVPLNKGKSCTRFSIHPTIHIMQNSNQLHYGSIRLYYILTCKGKDIFAR